MKRIIMTLLLVFVLAGQAAALPITYEFIYAGALFADAPNDAVVTGFITLESTAIQNPGYNVYDLTKPEGLAAVLKFDVYVTGGTGGVGNGLFHLNDFDKIVLDTRTTLTPLDFSKPLTSQVVYIDPESSASYTWGQTLVVPDSDPIKSLTGDFAFRAVAGSLAPTSIWPFQIGTYEASVDGLQLEYFAPVPEPATCLLFGAGLCGLVVLRRSRKQ